MEAADLTAAKPVTSLHVPTGRTADPASGLSPGIASSHDYPEYKTLVTKYAILYEGEGLLRSGL